MIEIMERAIVYLSARRMTKALTVPKLYWLKNE
jgi:hypothetical protein